jgi:hypothetical protein
MVKKDERWLSSPEVRKALKISTCDLAHLREQGVFRATKRGNAYLYAAADVAKAHALKLENARTCSLDSPE